MQIIAVLQFGQIWLLSGHTHMPVDIQSLCDMVR